MLLDADLDVEMQPYLEAVGFQTRFALHVSADHRSDVALLRWARSNGHILVCHDKFKDRTTRLELYPELKANGGRILRVTGNSSQHVLTAVGKILVNRENWRPWFQENDGVAILRREGVIHRTAEELYTTVERHLDPVARIRARESIPPTSRPASPTSPQENRLFDLDSQDDELPGLSG